MGSRCVIEGCDKPVQNKSRGWCVAHYERWRNHGDPTGGGPPKKKPIAPICTIFGCGKKHFAHGLCSAHYTRNRRYGCPHKYRRTPTGEPIAWLKSHVDHPGADCLEWPYAAANGYGVVTYKGRQRNASNVMCELAHGKPKHHKLEAAHSCGNGRLGCVNPRHLRWATRVENRHDMLIHGTRPMGERSGGAKLTASKVRQIRKAKADGEQVDAIAARFGISRSHVYLLHNRERWGWLE